jgi:hypothetical protein
MAGKGRPKTGGRDWKPGQSGNPKGPPAIDKHVREVKNLSAEEYLELASFLLRATDSDIEQVLSNPDSPKLEKIFAQVLKTTQETGSMSQLDLILNRLIGKPREAPPGEQSRNSETILAEIRKALNDPSDERKA